MTTLRASAERWEGEGFTVTIDGAPTGTEVTERQSRTIAGWLNNGALQEYEERIREAIRKEEREHLLDRLNTIASELEEQGATEWAKAIHAAIHSMDPSLEIAFRKAAEDLGVEP